MKSDVVKVIRSQITKVLTNCRNDLIAEHNVSGVESESKKIRTLIRSIDKMIDKYCKEVGK